MLSTSFIGYSKKEVNFYINNISSLNKRLFSEINNKISELKEENDKLKSEITRLKDILSRDKLKELDCYEAFIDEYFVPEWEEQYSKKATEIKNSYFFIIKELEKLLNNINSEILHMTNLKKELLNQLNEILIKYDNLIDKTDDVFNIRLKTDFIIEGKIVLPSGILISSEVINDIKEKGLLIELLKHLAKEEEL